MEASILNLVVNAKDAMAGKGKLTIETSNAFIDESYSQQNADMPVGQYVQLAVTDNGSGMSRDVQERAFDPFFTSKPPGQGTGLGLSQVYGFVKQSGGHVKIYSEVGEGTTVKIYLPRLYSDEAVATEETIEKIAHGHSGETVLMVEDDDDVRAYTRGILRELGYDVL